MFASPARPSESRGPDRNSLPQKADFPVTSIAAVRNDSMPLAFLITGDGGLTSFDLAICKTLADNGMPVLALDARKYFWNFRSPEETTRDVAETVLNYIEKWNKKKLILVGYSYGACVIPFIAARLPASLQAALSGIYCLSPDEIVDFEVHYLDMIGLGGIVDKYKVVEEVKKIQRFHPVCIYGDDESQKLRILFGEAGAKIIIVPGNHHYDNKPDVPALEIVKVFREGRKT